MAYSLKDNFDFSFIILSSENFFGFLNCSDEVCINLVKNFISNLYIKYLFSKLSSKFFSSYKYLSKILNICP